MPVTSSRNVLYCVYIKYFLCVLGVLGGNNKYYPVNPVIPSKNSFILCVLAPWREIFIRGQTFCVFCAFDLYLSVSIGVKFSVPAESLRTTGVHN